MKIFLLVIYETSVWDAPHKYVVGYDRQKLSNYAKYYITNSSDFNLDYPNAKPEDFYNIEMVELIE